jgi:hypothetical protein
MADLTARCALRDDHGVIDLSKGFARLREDPESWVCQPDVWGCRLAQLRTEFALHPTDVHETGGMCDMGPLGGSAEVEFLGERDEQWCVPRFHGGPRVGADPLGR